MSEPVSFADIQSRALNQVARSEVSVSAREIQLLLMAAAGLDKATLIARERDSCPAPVIKIFDRYMARRLQHEPVYRILGRREFHGLDLALNEATLEPRDDTECLVEASLRQISNLHSSLRILDLGTGTGAVALALLSELPNAVCVAVDIQQRALEVAFANARKHNLHTRFETLLGNWFDGVEGTFDIIVSNPPYISSSTVQKLDEEVRLFDPPVALDGGVDGLDAYRVVLGEARSYLDAGGFMGLEIGHDQKASVSQLAAKLGWSEISSFADLAGLDRALILR
ncbi:MAG: peptide chain release factor N(5)-glutamine methyltransferase [Rhizobiaceae bacterium]|nr:peptide chain release factor N(5)-glutamine methyltransferase [Rhizobiaceae bacterium]